MTFDNDGGFFLRHSVPGFPEDPSRGGYMFPKSGQTFGQTLLCITMSMSSMRMARALIANGSVWRSRSGSVKPACWPVHYQQSLCLRTYGAWRYRWPVYFL